MGAPMARNLLKAGHVLSVFDLNTQAVGTLVEAGAVAAVSPKDAVTGAETVITMLPAAAHVRHVLTAEDGVLAGIAKGVPIIDSSTIDPASAKALGAMAAEHGNPFVDAPVSGGTGGAAAGTLTFMAGGSAAAFEQVRPVLSAMGKNLVHCGDTGAGQGAKICNNLVLGITMAGVAEAMSLGEALGIDPKVLGGIINTSTGRCWSSDTYNPFPGVIDTAPSSRGYTGGFAALSNREQQGRWQAGFLRRDQAVSERRSGVMIELETLHEGTVAVLTLKRPPANAFTPEGLLQLQGTVERLNADVRVRAIVVTGDGPKFFSAGADLNTFADGDRDVAREAAARFGAAFEALQNARPVVIAAINGFAMGGGLECALACDIRIAEAHAKLAVPETASACCAAVAARRRCPGWWARAGPSA
ncbi:hypothetical protein Lal_00014653 [Lupinus albus]|nr:hypothetical protein Lal_00014653 [Lupinus albus]